MLKATNRANFSYPLVVFLSFITFAYSFFSRPTVFASSHPVSNSTTVHRTAQTEQPVRISVTSTEDSADEADSPAVAPLLTSIWKEVGGRRCKFTTSTSKISAAALRTGNGAALWVKNSASEKVRLDMSFLVPHGVYHLFKISVPVVDGSDRPITDRLEGVILRSKGKLSKSGWMHPGQEAIFVVSDCLRECQSGLKALRNGLGRIKADHPREYRLMITPLSDCADCIAKLEKFAEQDNSTNTMNYTHRALLSLSQVASVYRNALNDSRLPASASDMQTDIDSLERSLVDCSMVCLGLVPQIAMKSEMNEAQEIELSLSNQGKSTVSGVRIGISSPASAKVAPAESALFGSLTPGEAARTSFLIKPAVSKVTAPVYASFTYLSARIPARLRIKLN